MTTREAVEMDAEKAVKLVAAGKARILRHRRDGYKRLCLVEVDKDAKGQKETKKQPEVEQASDEEAAE